MSVHLENKWHTLLRQEVWLSPRRLFPPDFSPENNEESFTTAIGKCVGAGLGYGLIITGFPLTLIYAFALSSYMPEAVSSSVLITLLMWARWGVSYLRGDKPPYTDILKDPRTGELYMAYYPPKVLMGVTHQAVLLYGVLIAIALLSPASTASLVDKIALNTHLVLHVLFTVLLFIVVAAILKRMWVSLSF